MTALTLRHRAALAGRRERATGKVMGEPRRVRLPWPQLLSLLTLVIGLSLLLYPVASTLWHNHLATAAAAAQRRDMQRVPTEVVLRERAEAEAWNRAHPANRIAQLTATDEDVNKAEWASYLSQLDLTPSMGLLSIPSQGIQIPIKHGTDGNTLRRDIGHLYGSQLPIGGHQTHAVLTAHTGLVDASLFDNLDKIKLGDAFVLDVLGEQMQYRVHDIRVILPTDVDQLSQIPGDDIVTLLTCTPYGVNSHRLLVTGERVPLDPGAAAGSAGALHGWQWWMTLCLLLATLLLLYHARGWYRLWAARRARRGLLAGHMHEAQDQTTDVTSIPVPSAPDPALLPLGVETHTPVAEAVTSSPWARVPAVTLEATAATPSSAEARLDTPVPAPTIPMRALSEPATPAAASAVTTAVLPPVMPISPGSVEVGLPMRPAPSTAWRDPATEATHEQTSTGFPPRACTCRFCELLAAKRLLRDARARAPRSVSPARGPVGAEQSLSLDETSEPAVIDRGLTLEVPVPTPVPPPISSPRRCAPSAPISPRRALVDRVDSREPDDSERWRFVR